MISFNESIVNNINDDLYNLRVKSKWSLPTYWIDELNWMTWIMNSNVFTMLTYFFVYDSVYINMLQSRTWLFQNLVFDSFNSLPIE